MNYKEEILELLKHLKEAGIGRAQIEHDFEYAENFIDQTLARGGNKKILAALKIYCKAVLQKDIEQKKAGTAFSGVPAQNPGINDVLSSLGSISRGLDRVLNQQTLTRAEVRAYGQYQVSKDAGGNQEQIVKIMAQIGTLIGANLKANEKEGILS